MASVPMDRYHSFLPNISQQFLFYILAQFIRLSLTHHCIHAILSRPRICLAIHIALVHLYLSYSLSIRLIWSPSHKPQYQCLNPQLHFLLHILLSYLFVLQLLRLVVSYIPVVEGLSVLVLDRICFPPFRIRRSLNNVNALLFSLIMLSIQYKMFATEFPDRIRLLFHSDYQILVVIYIASPIRLLSVKIRNPKLHWKDMKCV